jgi:hypothetical protein
MMNRCILAVACLLLAPSILRAQALPSATRGGILQVGGGITTASSDYSSQRIDGVTAYSTFDLGRHVGIEADIHYISVITPVDFGENSYEIGPRYVLRYGHIEPYAKLMLGIGSGQFQQGAFTGNVHSSKYFLYAGGAGIDVRVGRNLNVRLIDLEMQKWPNFPPNSLTPVVMTFGVAYRLR